ncbi:MAG: hypothetical protein ACE5QW_03280 [Thermoplasmata archaeon]
MTYREYPVIDILARNGKKDLLRAMNISFPMGPEYDVLVIDGRACWKHSRQAGT